MENKNEQTRAQKKLIAHLLKRDPSLNEKTVVPVLNSIRRFVTVVHKIYTEPQAQISYKVRKVGNKTEKIRLIKTDLPELLKVVDKQSSLTEAFRKFKKAVAKDKNER